MSIAINRILHAGYIFDDGYSKIVFDPLVENPFSYNCYAFPHVSIDVSKIKNTKYDAIFISHYHDDHLSLKSLQYFDRHIPIYLYSHYDVFFELLRDLGFTEVHKIHLNQVVQIHNFAVTAWPALESDVDTIFQIQNKDINVLNVVDSWIDWQTHSKLSQLQWDVILWPFQIMREKEVLSPNRLKHENIDFPQAWTEQIKGLNPRYIVPSSCQFRFEDWSWYNHHFFAVTYQQFKQMISTNLKNTEVIILDPGQGYLFDKSCTKMASHLDWITIDEVRHSDYELNLNVVPSHTSNIAHHFQQLQSQESIQVHQFCQNEIPRKLTSIFQNTNQESYWKEKTKNWKLIVYDHLGQPISYIYCIDSESVTLLSADTVDVIDWQTEILEFKLYSAMINGESLISLYVRINDILFTDQVEKNLTDIDLLEDPLLKCLYSEDVAHYQKRQLKLILESSNGFLPQNKFF